MIRWVTAVGSNVAFKIATKPLQIETWLFLTTYIKSPSPYPMVPSPTPTTDRLTTIHVLRTDRRQTHDISYTRSRGNKIMQIFTKLRKYL